MTIGWAFQPNLDSSWDGWNDPAIAGFKGRRLESLTREIIQNSLDAAADTDGPVQVEFTEQILPADQIPDFEELKATLQKCWKHKDEEGENAVAELRQAIECSKKAKIPVLSIADYFTNGMPGPCKLGKPFFSYLKARGQSGGEQNRGGSHGIGKAAPLCASDLRTIFVSTRWEENEDQERSMIQGRTTLMSHVDDGQTKSGMGFWGQKQSYDAIDESECEYEWLQRDMVGTTVHVVGWNRITRDWKFYVLGCAAVNFFAAFARNKLVLGIDGDEIDHTNIAKIMELPNVEEAMRKQRQDHRLEEAKFFYRCITDDDAIDEETQLVHLGRSSVKMIVEEDAPRKIAIIRKNMLITDQLSTYWRRMPARLKDFGGVFECLDNDGEKLLRSMEPPAHDDLSTGNMPLSEIDKGEAALNALGNKLKEISEKHASPEFEEAGQIDFLKEFFSDEADDGDSDQELEDRDPNGQFIVTPKPVKLPPPKFVKLDEEPELEPEGEDPDLPGNEGGAGEGGGGGGDGGGIGPGFGPGTGGTGDRSDEARPDPARGIELRDIRFIRLDDNQVRMIATPTESANVRLAFYEVGADTDDPLTVADNTVGELEGGKIELNVTGGERFSIEFSTDRDLVGGIKSVATIK
ncbi:MAG: hypothetical protein OXH94_03390 [Rhodospirillales bacterium]|nr:hypothetical protein [Rhodospirillales bacterium]